MSEQKTKNNILLDLISNQVKNVPTEKKLSYSDLIRISKNLNSSIFGNQCAIWTGYVTSIKHDDRNVYINFYNYLPLSKSNIESILAFRFFISFSKFEIR